MKNKFIYNCVIIGSGPAGYTAAIYAARADLSPIIYTGLQPGGQLTTTTLIDNFPGYKKGILGTQMMQDLQEQCKRFGTKIIYDTITSVNFSSNIGGIHKLYANEIEILTKSVIISTGASAKYLGLKAEKKFLGRGVSACATCDGFFYKGLPVIVVGGGDTALEEAIYLSKICSKIIILVRKGKLKASKVMIHQVTNISNIEILFYHELIDIQGNKNVEKAIILNKEKNITTSILISGIFISIGHHPNTSIFDQIEKDNYGYLITKSKSSKTNFPGIFAAGDVQDSVYRQAITAAGSGCIAALDAEKYLSNL